MSKKKGGRDDGKLPRMDFYVADFLSDARVAAMSPAGVGVYTKILCHLWWSGPLGTNLTTLARILGFPEREVRKVWPEVMPCLILNAEAETFTQSRLERERQIAIANRDRKRRGAETTNANRWGAERSLTDGTDGDAQRSLSDSHSGRPSPVTRHPSHTHPPPAAGSLTGPLDGAEACVCDGLSPLPNPNPGPACPEHAAPPPPPPRDDDLDAHLQRTWNRLRAELHRLPPERLTEKHQEAWSALLEACDSRLEECERTIRAYLEWRDRFLVDAAWSINVFPARAGAVLMRLREQQAKRLKVVERPAPTEPDGEVVPLEESKARIAELRSMLGGKS